MNEVYLNGEFLPIEQAQVSVLDRGFLFGDGVYEVIPAYGGQPFRLAQHLARLARSLAAIRLPDPLSATAWQDLLAELIRRQSSGRGDADWSIYLQLTRGSAAKRDHAFPAGVRPTVFAMATPLPTAAATLAAAGVAAVTLPDPRWAHCDIKAITLLANVLARQSALDSGAAEAILIRDGVAWEGAASNLFIVAAGELVTPPNGPFLLPGVTRDLVLELAHARGIPTREAPIGIVALRQAEEIWLTSSTREILPVTRLDEALVGVGRPGPMWQRLHTLYQDFKQSLRSGSAT